MKRSKSKGAAVRAAQSASRNPAVAVRPGRFLVLFFIFLLVGFGLLLTPLVHRADLVFSRGLTFASAELIRLFGGQVQTEGAVLRHPLRGFGIEMQDGCNGTTVMILLWAAMCAFPASWKSKIKGLLAGTAAIQVVNLLRFISLFYLGQYSRPMFDFMHLYLWESLIMLFATAVFWLWARAQVRL